MSQNGKGSAPRSNYSKEFRANYDEIDWSSPKCDFCDGDGIITWHNYEICPYCSGKELTKKKNSDIR